MNHRQYVQCTRVHGLDTLVIFRNSVVRSAHPGPARGEIVTPYSLLPSKQQTALEIISTWKGRQSERKTNTEKTYSLQSQRLHQHSRRKGSIARTDLGSHYFLEAIVAILVRQSLARGCSQSQPGNGPPEREPFFELSPFLSRDCSLLRNLSVQSLSSSCLPATM